MIPPRTTVQQADTTSMVPHANGPRRCLDVRIWGPWRDLPQKVRRTCYDRPRPRGVGIAWWTILGDAATSSPASQHPHLTEFGVKTMLLWVELQPTPITALG